jgi:hypothetical protein
LNPPWWDNTRIVPKEATKIAATEITATTNSLIRILEPISPDNPSLPVYESHD